MSKKEMKEKRLERAFKGKNAFIGFLTAGDPSKEKTVEYILTMEKAGADVIEIGIPFSDPTAEGPVIERANKRALDRGMKVKDVFEIVRSVREKSEIPLVFLSYLNVLFHYGYEKFFKECKESGVDGIIIPDLPFEEKDEIAIVAQQNQIAMISLIAPTSRKRIAMISKQAQGFIYLVSSLGVTGVRSELSSNLCEIVQEIRKCSQVPCAVGFGIHTPSQAKETVQYADGVIVGSAIVNIIETFGEDATKELFSYVKKMKNRILENV